MSNRLPPKDLLRLARRLYEKLGTEMRPTLPAAPEFSWRRLMRLGRLARIAEERNWPAAMQRLHRELRAATAMLIGDLERNLQRIEDWEPAAPIASLRDVYADLLALRNEFGDVEGNLKERTLSVVTESIVLEGIELGPFRIVLHLDAIGNGTPYEVIALEPRPARESSSTTHPHVQNDTLCEGEGKAAIRAALEQGRIFDLFLLIRQILVTYNPSSPHIPLERWEGIGCRDCGAYVDEDELACCDRCDAELCSECTDYCECCNRTCCGRCRERCPGCDDTTCDRCLLPCSVCEEKFCPACLENNVCDTCHEQKESQDAATAETTPTETPGEVAGPPVHSHGLGQVCVPA